MIKELQEKDVDLDDEENSSFLLECRSYTITYVYSHPTKILHFK